MTKEENINKKDNIDEDNDIGINTWITIWTLINNITIKMTCK